LVHNISVSEIEGTDIVKVKFESLVPKTSALVANQAAASFNDLDADRRLNLASSAQGLLEEELYNVQTKLRGSEKRLNRFSRITGIVDMSDKTNLANARTDSLGAEFITAQSERMSLQIQVDAAKQSPNLLSVSSISEHPSIVTLRSDLTLLESEYSQMATTFRPGYPPLDALGQKIALQKQKMRTEAKRVFEVLLSKYANAVESEKVLSKELKKANVDILDLKDRAITFNLLQREWETNKKLYDGLLEKVKSSSLAANLELDRLSLMEQATIPSSKASPSITKNVTLASTGGFLFAMALAFLMNLLDRRFRTVRQLEESLGLPVLAIVPDVHKFNSDMKAGVPLLLDSHESKSAIGETFRSLKRR